MPRGLLNSLKYRLTMAWLRDLTSNAATSKAEMRALLEAARTEDTVLLRLNAVDAELAAAALRADRFEASVKDSEVSFDEFAASFKGFEAAVGEYHASVTHHLAHLSYILEGPTGRAAHNEEAVGQLAQTAERLSLALSRQGATLDMLARPRASMPDAPIRVVLLVNYMQAWDSLAEVYQALESASDFDVTVASIEGRHGEYIAHQALEDLHVPHLRLVGDSELGLMVLKSIRPDVIFRQHPWDDELPVGFRTESLSFARLCYVPYYGMQVLEDFGAEDHGNNLHTDQPFHRACWRIYCENQAVHDIYCKTSVLGGKNAVVVGHPKLTRLSNMRGAEPYWPIEAPRTSSVFRIIWAPHHSVGNEWMNFGSFAIIMDDMLQWARSDPSLEIVLRPHPSLFGFMRGGEWTTLVSPEQFASFLRQWNDLPNTSIDERATYASLFVGSDLMITDGISFLTEYQIFGKPLVFFERADHAPFNEIGQLIAGGTLRVDNFPAMRQVIEAFRKDGLDPSAAARSDVVARIVSPTDPSSAILEDIRRGLPAPHLQALHLTCRN